jgi:hypothetical protein
MRKNSIGAFVGWLLESGIPTIRYQTQVDVLERPGKDPARAKAFRAIRRVGPVPAILSRQGKTGAWIGERSFYTPKFVSSHWSMMLLEELSLDHNDPLFRRGAQHMVAASAEGLGQQLHFRRYEWSCFWGNLLRYSYGATGNQETDLEDLVTYLTMDLRDGPCRCRHNGGYPCAWGVVRSLWGLGAIPKARRTPTIRAAIRAGADFLLDSYSLAKADYPSFGKRGVSSLWFGMNFPLFYQADILFTLRVLGELDLLGVSGAKPALDWLEGRRKPDGRWQGSSPFRQRTWSALGGREETDRWVSLQAFRILRQARRLQISAA